MRKLIFAINLTLDGCCDHTRVEADDELHDYHTNLLRQADVLLYGRKTWQLMVPFWPDMALQRPAPNRSLNDFAQAFVAVKEIVVVSRTLHHSESMNTRFIGGDLTKEITRLKQAPGKDILVGGVDLPSQLIQLGLVDEYRFVVQPRLVGDGRRLLEGVNLLAKLKLADSTIMKSGTIALRYVNR